MRDHFYKRRICALQCGGYVVIARSSAPPRTRSVRHSHWAPLRTSQLTCTLEPEAAKPAKPQHIFSGSLVVSQGLSGESEWGHGLAHLCSVEGLVAGAYRRCQPSDSHSIADEGWRAGKQANVSSTGTRD